MPSIFRGFLFSINFHDSMLVHWSYVRTVLNRSRLLTTPADSELNKSQMEMDGCVYQVAFNYIVIPMNYIILLTLVCISLVAEFELNIAVIFDDDYLVTENFPILLLRSR